MEGKLSVNDTISEVFHIYRSQAGVLLPVAFWLFLAVAVVEELTSDRISLFWIGVVAGLAIGTLYQGMVVGLVSDIQDGRRDSSVGELVRSVLPVLGPLVGAGVLAALGVAGGFLLLIVPGLYLLTIWAVVAPVIVVERRGIFDAFGRSRQLVRDNGWRVFGTVSVAFLLAALASLFFIAVADAVAEGVLTRIVFSSLALTVTAPIEALVASVLYFRLRALKGEPAPPDSTTPSEPAI
jgi:hypothetical protein